MDNILAAEASQWRTTVTGKPATRTTTKVPTRSNLLGKPSLQITHRTRSVRWHSSSGKGKGLILRFTRPVGFYTDINSTSRQMLRPNDPNLATEADLVL